MIIETCKGEALHPASDAGALKAMELRDWRKAHGLLSSLVIRKAELVFIELHA
jgi:hypothetical protein